MRAIARLLVLQVPQKAEDAAKEAVAVASSAMPQQSPQRPEQPHLPRAPAGPEAERDKCRKQALRREVDRGAAEAHLSQSTHRRSAITKETRRNTTSEKTNRTKMACLDTKW